MGMLLARHRRHNPELKPEQAEPEAKSEPKQAEPEAKVEQVVAEPEAKKKPSK